VNSSHPRFDMPLPHRPQKLSLSRIGDTFLAGFGCSVRESAVVKVLLNVTVQQ